MRARALIIQILASVLAGCGAATNPVTAGNPFFITGSSVIDGRLGSFGQNNTGDCFFLATLLALAQDADGRKLLQSTIYPSTAGNGWQIVFPNLSDQIIYVNTEEIINYHLLSSDGHALSSPAWGDPDVGLLEIAADKFWKQRIKAEGLWDDVPMNALFMFTNARQLLLWNRGKGKAAHNRDIDKYLQFSKQAVVEVEVSSRQEALARLQQIVNADRDGISMILIDYANYHAVAISAFDFAKHTFSFIDTNLVSHPEIPLSQLLEGLMSGFYALNYLEIK